MATKQIHDYTAAVTIDPAADFFLLDPGSTGSYRKISRNVALNLTSAPLGLTDIASPTNKTFNNTNIFTIRDDRFTLQDNGDTTKQATFQLSGITTATTRTYTLPNASTTLVGSDNTATLTNKSLTSPVITGGSISNATIAVNSIAEFTAAAGVTIDGVTLKDAEITTAGAVGTQAIADDAVTPAKLQAGAGTGWAWATWAPSWTGLTPGNGTLNEAKYTQIGKTVFFKLKFTLGNTSAVTGSVSFTLPKTSVAINNDYIGFSLFDNAAGSTSSGIMFLSSTTTATVAVSTAGGTYVAVAVLAALVPYTWATNMFFKCQGFYETV